MTVGVDLPIGPSFGSGWQWMLEGHHQAGVTVTRNTLLGSPFWWRGISIISSTIGRLPLNIYKRLKDGSRQVDEEHYAHDFMRYPNPYSSIMDLLCAAVNHACTFGNGYIRVKWTDPDFKPELAYILDPELTWPMRQNGKLWYHSHASTGAIVVEPNLQLGQLMTLQPYEVLHIRGHYSNDGLIGVPPIAVLQDALSSGLGLQRYLNTFLKRGGAVQKQILLPGFFKDQEEMKEFKKGFAEEHETLDNANKTPVFQGGAKVETVGQTNKESELQAAREFEIKVVAACLGLPPHLLGSINSQSYGTLEQENRSLLLYTFESWLSRIESELDLKLTSTVQQKRGSHYWSFGRDALERGDDKTQNETLRDQVNNGLLSLNQALALRDLPGIGPAGDKHRMPSTLTFQEDASALAEINTEKAENPPEPQVMISSQPVADPTPEDDEDKDKPKEDTLERQLTSDVRRLLNRMNKATDKPLDHIQICAEALPVVQRDKIKTWLTELGEEIDAVLPEQRDAVFARQRPEQIVRELCKTTT